MEKNEENEDIKNVRHMLQNHEELEHNITIRRNWILERMMELDDMIDGLCHITKGNEELTVSQTNRQQDPVFQVYLRIQDMRDELMILQKADQELSEREKELRRICSIFNRLYSLFPKAYYITYEIDFLPRTAKTYTWASLSKKMGIGKLMIGQAKNFVYEVVCELHKTSLATESIVVMPNEELLDYLEQNKSIASQLSKHFATV